MTYTQTSRQAAAAPAAPASPEEISQSCRIPVLLALVSAAIWLALGSLLALLGSLKFHAPGMLAGCPWFTYGRVAAASWNILLYGFASQAAVAVALWLICRLGRTKLVKPGLVALGIALWNTGVLVGVGGVLGGAQTGFEWMELPVYSFPFLLGGYAVMAMFGVMTFIERKNDTLFPSQWFLLAALFWLPWVYLIAQTLLVFTPVRGVLQAVIHNWYAHNVSQIWLGFIGLGAIFYFIPKITGKELHSRYHAMFAFWVLLFLGSIGGIAHSTPVPAWLPSVSTVMGMIVLLAVASIALNLDRTLAGNYGKALSIIPLRFILFGAAAYILSAALGAFGSLHAISETVNFTFFTTAQKQLFVYGFFAMVMFGAIYYIAPSLCWKEWPNASLVKMHFGLSALGILIYVASLGFGGIVQGAKLNNAAVPFMDAAKASMMFFRLSTLGDLLILGGNLLLLANLGLLLKECCCGAGNKIRR